MFSPLLIMLLVFVGYIVAYNTYGKFIASKLFKINPQAEVPSKALADGDDFVESSKQVTFGHHFTSIAGTGPIVGPAIGVIWGWAPALLWVFFGSIFMGAVHDFATLIISMRNEGRSISDIAGDIIHPHVRLLFFVIVFLALWIVLAIFGLIIALIFERFPSSVIAVWIEVPISICFGKWALTSHRGVAYKTVIAVGLMYVFVFLGHYLPFTLPNFAWMPATGTWTIILLIYAFIASVMPVRLLLQPRDYLNAWQLYIAMGLILIGAIVSGISGQLHFAAPAFQAPVDAPALWPFLFITIACGAISGFHSLVCSGTTSKQIASESHVQFIGFGSMLLEGALATIIIIAVAAGLGMGYPLGDVMLTGREAFMAHYGSFSQSSGLGSQLSAVVIGCANMMHSIGISLEFGVTIIGVFIASFAGTTLDSAARIQRYVISELGRSINKPILCNKYIATSIAVLTGALLAFSSGLSGKGALALWPLFGAVNQLLGGLALLVSSVYLARRVRYWALITVIPCVIIMSITLWAAVENHAIFVAKTDYLLIFINAMIFFLALLISFRSVLSLYTSFKRSV